MAKMSTSPASAAWTMPPMSQLLSCLPTQLRRAVPIYAGAVFILVLFVNLNLFSPSHGPNPVPRFLPTMEPHKSRIDFPHKIWQTWKVSPLWFEPRDHQVAKSWPAKNRDWRYEVITDGNDMNFVHYHYGPEGFNRPDIVDFYGNVSASIVKADLLRYLIMYAEGGLYADIDVEALRPIAQFVPERYNIADIDAIVGVEIDEPDWKDHPILGPKSRSFCQWTFMAKPRLPVMMRLIEEIMFWLTDVANKQRVPLPKVELDFNDVISGTGPSAFTNAIMGEMNSKHSVEKRGRRVTWDDFHDLRESKVVDRVLVLTVEAFAAGQGHSDSGNHESRAALVLHHYHASNWPSRHHRFKHPVYGKVERCNWNDDCIHKWDQDVADFEKLPAAEKRRMIAEKERKDKEEEEKGKKEEEARRAEEEQRKKKENAERILEEARKIQEEKKEEERKEAEERKNAGKAPPHSQGSKEPGSTAD